MKIKQFEDRNLAHYSYAVVSEGQMALIDPARDPEPYYAFAKEEQAKITVVIETHPHADFVSSHLEIHKTTGATIYVSKLVGALYPHKTFDDGDTIVLGNITLKALNTPGHSPDSISILVADEGGKEAVVFTGDTLFIGDCGRPDLREVPGDVASERTVLARQMYHSLRNKLMTLPDDVIVYPAHGAGSLCGKGLSENNSSTIGAEKLGNWSLQEMDETHFIKELLSDQPFIPKYFSFDVGINKKGAGQFDEAIKHVKRVAPETAGLTGKLIIDTRDQAQFKKGHDRNAINLMEDNNFETWLGSIVNPGESFILKAENEFALNRILKRIASIGYESQVEAAVVSSSGSITDTTLDYELLYEGENRFTIIDVRNPGEVKTRKVFNSSINIPLYELRERISEIPTAKPIVVHCAAGYRSAAGSSILQAVLGDKVKVYDLGVSVKEFSNELSPEV